MQAHATHSTQTKRRSSISTKNGLLKKVGFNQVDADYHGTLYGRMAIIRATRKVHLLGFTHDRNIGHGFSDEITSVYVHADCPGVEIRIAGDYSSMDIEPRKGYTYRTM